jgi:hypothetical protein
MPGFLFCVGMAMRLTFVRRAATDGRRAAYLKAIKRNLGLIFVGCVVYHFTGGFKTWAEVETADWSSFLLSAVKRHPFEALTHIGVTSLFVLPVIDQHKAIRVAYAIAAGLLHVWASDAGYYKWNLANPVGIDGGPLGFLTWSIPLLVGSLTVDELVTPRKDFVRFLYMGVLWMLCAFLLSRQTIHGPFPLVHSDDVESLRQSATYWTMSQRAGSVTYTWFGAGFSLALFALFRLACDGYGLRWSYFDLFGKHALVAYVAHDFVMGMVKPFVPKDAPAWYVLAGFAVVLAALTLILRYFDRNKFAVRL